MVSMRSAHVAVFVAFAGIAAASCDNHVAGPSTDDGAPPPVGALRFSDWSPAMDIESAFPGAHPNFNTSALEGCPFISPDGKRFFIASDRPGGLGGLDIWVSTRAGVDDPWGVPVNVGEPVNSAANDFCPTLERDGQTFYFVSTRPSDEACSGGGDIYITRLRDGGGFDELRRLGCPVNSSANEFSPFPIPNSPFGPALYFSSTRPGLGTGGDIFMAGWDDNQAFATPELVPGVNSPVDDGHPNVRRDGGEIFFYSVRADLPGPQGGNDIYSAARRSILDPWSTPVNLGANINSPASETRPSLSWDGTRLYFGSDREGGEGSSDIYVSTRDRIPGS